jgi:hypothetical protein
VNDYIVIRPQVRVVADVSEFVEKFWDCLKQFPAKGAYS